MFNMFKPNLSTSASQKNESTQKRPDDLSTSQSSLSNNSSITNSNRNDSATTNNTTPNTLDTQRQKLNQLVELISNQEAKLNRLKALRKLAKEQAAVNVGLNNELKTVNKSISEKDGELRQALNRVDNLNRQLNNYRRTRTHRSSRGSTTPVKQDSYTVNADGGGAAGVGHAEDSNNSINATTTTTTSQTGASAAAAATTTTTSATANLPLSSSSEATNSNSTFDIENISARESSPIPDLQDLTKTKLLNTLDKVEGKLSHNITNSPAKDSKQQQQQQQVAHNHASPALTKYTNARQKLSGFKDKSALGRRVSFDPLALLLDAALEGELDLVIQTSKQVPDLSASHDECVTALHNAVVAGHYEVAKFLIEAGCDINTQDSDGWTPLHCAASCNNLPLVKLLVENGALIYATTTSDLSTPAMKCEQSEEGFEECYKYLMYLQNNLGVMNNGLVYALYDYEPQEPDELSFKTDDELLILRRDDSQEQEWWWAQKRIKETSDSVVDIKEGYIPRNLVGLYPRVKSFRRPRISEVNSKNGNGSTE